MSTVALDSSVVVAALVRGHTRHAAALVALQRALKAESVVLPLPALLESYSVLTRLPAPHRLGTKDAWQALSRTFGERARLVSLTGPEGLALLGSAAGSGLAGGVLYDAQIAACARKGGARQILTLNRRHFERVDPDLSCVEP